LNRGVTVFAPGAAGEPADVSGRCMNCVVLVQASDGWESTAKFRVTFPGTWG
jgi:hypothetical protein